MLRLPLLYVVRYWLLFSCPFFRHQILFLYSYCTWSVLPSISVLFSCTHANTQNVEHEPHITNSWLLLGFKRWKQHSKAPPRTTLHVLAPQWQQKLSKTNIYRFVASYITVVHVSCWEDRVGRCVSVLRNHNKRKTKQTNKQTKSNTLQTRK